MRATAPVVLLTVLFAALLAGLEVGHGPVVVSGGVVLPSTAQVDGVWVAVYNGAEVNATIANLTPYLRAGDGIAIVMGGVGNWSKDGGWAAQLRAAFPNVTLRAYTSLDGGLGTAGGLATTIGPNLSAAFTQVSGDWEVNGAVEFDPHYAPTLAAQHNLSAIVRPTGRAAVGYLSGRGVLGDYSQPPYAWDYGAFATALDGMTVETQGLCHNGTQWSQGLTKLWGEYNASGLSTTTLSVQISLGVGANGVNESDAIGCAQYAEGLNHGNLFFFWGVAQLPWLVGTLQALGR